MRNSDVYITGTWNGFLSRFRWLLFFGFMVSALTCCGGNAFEWLADENSKEARIEEALIALDDGEYERARAILTALQDEYPNDGTIAAYLSNAIAGAIGIDTFTLLETIDQLSGDIDMVGKLLGDADGNLTANDITYKLSELDEAIGALTNLPGDLTPDQKVQLGLLSLNHAALTIADAIADDLDITDNSIITLTEDGIKTLFDANTTDLSDLSDVTDISVILSDLSEDINNISESIEAIATIVGGGSGNDLSDSFEDFLKSLDENLDDTISEDELEDYLINLGS
jgi:hypothetical protein